MGSIPISSRNRAEEHESNRRVETVKATQARYISNMVLRQQWYSLHNAAICSVNSTGRVFALQAGSYGFESLTEHFLVPQLSWLERLPVTQEVFSWVQTPLGSRPQQQSASGIRWMNPLSDPFYRRIIVATQKSSYFCPRAGTGNTTVAQNDRFKGSNPFADIFGDQFSWQNVQL